MASESPFVKSEFKLLVSLKEGSGQLEPFFFQIEQTFIPAAVFGRSRTRLTHALTALN